MFISVVACGITLHIELARIWIFRCVEYRNCGSYTLAAAYVDDHSRINYRDKPMNRTLYLHIGLLKTGTSAIQRFLGYKRALLARKGIIVPGDQVEENLHHDIALQASIWANAETAQKNFLSGRENRS